MTKTCYQMLQSGANKKGFVVFYGHKIPMTKFLDDIERCAAGFVQLNLHKGDVVTIYLPTCPQSLVAFYACSKLGLVANFVHPTIPLALLQQNLQKVGSKALLFYDVLLRDEKQLAEFGQILVRCSIADYVTFRKPFFQLYAATKSKHAKGVVTYRQLISGFADTQVQGQAQDVVCYMHSGGTSGTPKIVKLSNEAFNGTAEAMIAMYQPNVQPTDYNLVTLPIFHAYGLCAAIHTPLCFGCNLILVPKFDVKVVKKCFAKYHITIWSVVPAMLKKMIAANCLDSKGLSGLDVIWCGGDVVDEQLVQQVDEILAKHCVRAKLMRGYGLTETCGVCVVNNYFHYQKESCGQPMPTCKVQIWDDCGNVLPVNTNGEIVVQCRGNMQGYVEGEDCRVDKDGEMWVQTGDVGHLDENGFLYVVDRKKRTLKIAAVNVFPAEVEAVVKKLPFVDEACAVGVWHNGKQFVKVFVTLMEPTDSRVVAEKVKQICMKNLIKYSVPQFVQVLDKMPRTPLGKTDFKALEKLQ